MSDANGVIRMIAWRDLFPWWVLFRVFRSALSPSILSLATAAALLMPVGWWVGGMLFLPPDLSETEPLFHAKTQYLQTVTGVAGVERLESTPWQDGRLVNQPLVVTWDYVKAASRDVYGRFVEPFVLLARPGQPLSRYAYLVFGGLWTLLVWSFFGGAITRIAAVRFGPEQRIGLTESLDFARRRLSSYFLAPLFPLIAVGVIVLLTVPLGLLMKLDLGVAVAGVVWPILLIASVLMGVLLLGLIVGWPLMWATISSEESGDVFEATQRCYSYTFDRPLNYLLYIVLATVLGGLGTILVKTMGETVIALSFWSVSWGLGAEAGQEIANQALDPESVGGAATWGAWLIGLSCGFVRCVSASYVYAFFWSASSAVYLLLRLDVDQTELDEVFIDEDHEKFDLPALHMDEAGVPGAPEETAESKPTESDTDSPDAANTS